jgi:prohibitin 1
MSLETVQFTHFNFLFFFFSLLLCSCSTAQQDAERSRYVVLKAEQEKKAAIIRAEGETEAARLLNEAMKSGPGFIQLRRIEAAREIAETLSKSRNVTYIPENGSMLINMRTGSQTPSK